MARETITHGRSTLPEQVGSGVGISRLRPTGRGVSVGVVAIVLVAVVLRTGDSALLLVLVVLAIPLAIAPIVVSARARRAAGIDVHMMVTPPLVPVGAPCSLVLQLSHSGGAGLPPLSLDRPSDHWSAGAPLARQTSRWARLGAALATDIGRVIRWDGIGSDTSALSTLALPTRRRGVFTVGPLRLWVHDPFGMLALTVAIAKPVTLVVHPPALLDLALSSVLPGSSRSTQFGDGPAEVQTDDPGGEWSGLRPYEPGDRLHLLSWQAEARFGALLVHDFRPDSEDAVVTIVFDDRAGVHRRHAFENALSAIFGLASAAAGRGTDYDLSTLSGRGVRGSMTPDGLVALLTFLAETQPTRSSQYARLSASTLPTAGLLVTTPTAVPTLPLSLDHGSVVVVK